MDGTCGRSRYLDLIHLYSKYHRLFVFDSFSSPRRRKAVSYMMKIQGNTSSRGPFVYRDTKNYVSDTKGMLRTQYALQRNDL